ncbi:MAG: DUF29 family protein [Chloroflexi bacterium]|nr:MAG: DUF29 family protein [Chloroflexota bacterium]
MEELLELREHIQQGRYASALDLIGEMEDMSRDDKINRVESFLEILLLHLIKQQAEARTTRSWDVSIRNAVAQIVRTNRRRKVGGFYLTDEELNEAVSESYPSALRRASLEAFGGVYSPEDLAAMVDESAVAEEALGLILEAQA